jgi:hypothetical protein
MVTKRQYAFLFPVLMCIWLGCHRAPVGQSENQPKRRTPPDGEQWLAWQAPNREEFVSAYLDGYFFGAEDACNVFDDLEPTISLKHYVHCRAKAPRYSVKSDSAGYPDLNKYTDVITRFYTEHPEERTIPYARLMPYLTDEQHKTADDLYNMAKAGKFRTIGGGLGG